MASRISSKIILCVFRALGVSLACHNEPGLLEYPGLFFCIIICTIQNRMESCGRGQFGKEVWELNRILNDSAVCISV